MSEQRWTALANRIVWGDQSTYPSHYILDGIRGAIYQAQVRAGHVLFAARGNHFDHAGLVVSVDGDELNFIHATTSAGVRVTDCPTRIGSLGSRRPWNLSPWWRPRRVKLQAAYLKK